MSTQMDNFSAGYELNSIFAKKGELPHPRQPVFFHVNDSETIADWSNTSPEY